MRTSLRGSKLLAFALGAALAFAASVNAIAGDIQAIVVPDGAHPGGPEVATRVYDNWTNPPSLLNNLFVSGSDEIGDDLNLVAGGILDNMGINAANVNGTSNLTGGTIAIRFYALSGGAFISGFNANLPAVALAAGGSTRLSFGAGALTSFNINIPASGVLCSLQWTAATFSGAGSIANLGFQLRGPIAVGSSSDNLTNVTTNTTFNFGGNPRADTGLFLDVNPVPEPASLSLIGLGVLGLATRRRRA